MLPFTVNTSGTTLRSFLKERLDAFALSTKQIKRLIDLGQCSVDGKIEKFSSTKLKKGQTVEISLDLVSKGSKKPSFKPESILFEDEYYLIYNKPSGLECSPNAVQAFFPFSAYLVHRLDKATTGALLLAKSADAQEKGEDLFRERTIDKTYLAEVKGLISSTQKKSSGKIVSHLIQIARYDGQRLYGSVEKHPAKVSNSIKQKYAETDWEVLEESRGRSKIRCYPRTGRTHQIRVHLSELGHPILGDPLYGRNAGSQKRLHLHAESLKFTHPFTGESVVVMAPSDLALG